MQAAHHAQALQQRNADLEAENRILKEAVQQHKMSAIEWCMQAKEYQQDRNMMTLRLEELEMELVRTTHIRRAGKSSSATAGSSSSSHQQSSKAKSSARATKDDEDDNDLDARHQFLNQSITQILDEMTPAQIEPVLPIRGKAHNGGHSQDINTRASELPSAVNQPYKSTKCKCGCQEELRALKTRCKYAENRATAQELRCEQMIVYKDAFKTKWTQWREDQIQQQYQQRMKAAMPFNTSQYMSPFQSASFQQQHSQQQQQQQQGSFPMFSYEGGFKRARFESEGSETSSQRQKRTERNTLYNQITTSFVPGGQAEQRKPSTNIRRATGKGSAEEPHILVDRDEGSSSEGFVGPITSPKRHRMETPVLDSSDGNEATTEYSAMSPTFPSDMTLHLRQYQLKSEEDDEDSDGYTSPSSRSIHCGQPRHRRESPNALTNRSHRQDTSSRAQRQRRITVAPDSIASETNAPATLSDYASDRSSPPMFDTADFVAREVSSRSRATADGAQISPVHRSTGGEGSSKSRTGALMASRAAKTTTADKHHSKFSTSAGVPNSGRRDSSSAEPFTVYEDPDPAPTSVVLETPLEIQGTKGNMSALTAKAAPEVIEIAEDDRHATPEHVINGGDGGESGYVDVDINGDGGSDKENSPPEPSVVERRGSVGMMEFEETTAASARRGISPSKANVPEERIYNYTERRKNKRKLMHGHNCECCRRFYEITGPLPLPDGYSHFFQPIPRPGEREVWEKTDEERLQERIQQMSRHRVQHVAPLTPPGYWNTDFPSTPERKKWDEIDRERRDRKRQQEEHQAEQQQRQRRSGGGSSSSRAGPSGASRSKF
ncbi:hypothetical protein BGZ96_001407 [Linnemannia gamsii]|uniref:DNA endonuclease activator Ctp1 C-terminal domain-containing protein n=1 Tax=Linnemannia gamsii TaxID=64522 RepID=A0ABQ7KA05_9FUNG|nr:hypothetical protein BGZ96_001407 [Linnemannia gamsii]